MPTYRNAGPEPRTWINVSAPEGTTLHLDPGEEVELESAPSNDLFLRPVPARKTEPKPKADPAPAKPSEES